LEVLRPDVQAKRVLYLEEVRQIPVERLVFIDESGMNLSMCRSHAWVKRGSEYVERVPMNRGKNLTLLGAIRLDGWVVLTSMYNTTNGDRFVQWFKRDLLPRLNRGDVIVMDNLSAHHDPRIPPACEARGIRVIYLPPYSPDLNPIEPAWALQKQFVRRQAPRQAELLRKVARKARHRITQRHCRNWFSHCGYQAHHR
jgi:transposase